MQSNVVSVKVKGLRYAAAKPPLTVQTPNVILAPTATQQTPRYGLGGIMNRTGKTTRAMLRMLHRMFNVNSEGVLHYYYVVGLENNIEPTTDKIADLLLHMGIEAERPEKGRVTFMQKWDGQLTGSRYSIDVTAAIPTGVHDVKAVDIIYDEWKVDK